MINIIIALIFITMSITYFYVLIINKIKITEESVILGIFAILYIANCFIYSGLGFISIVVINNVVNCYLVIGYAGTKSALRYLYRNDKKNFNNLFYPYCIISAVFISTLIICNQLAIEYSENFFVMLPKGLIPFYTGLILFYTVKFPPVITGKTLLNLNIFSFFISLYEEVDFIIYLSNMKYYNTWNIYYVDKTFLFDIIWLTTGAILWLFLPRIIYVYNQRKLNKK
jgi:hypothetical protein